MAELKLKNLCKRYSSQHALAVNRLNLEIKDGEFIAILGPSGCGKSTTLRMVAGLEDITDGQIMIGDREVNRVHPKDRHIGLAFENYALYPPLTVRQNLAFNLKAVGKLSLEEINKRVNDIASYMQITDLLDLKPSALGSGQKQRVNIARALVRRPAVLLLDEPLSHLDAALRVQMRTEIKRLHIEQKFTSIIVTHDQLEAMALTDRIAVMNEGVLQQFDTPLQVFNHPANEFVAGFLGDPPMNIFATERKDQTQLVIPGTDFCLPIQEGIQRLLGSRDRVKLGVRPWGIKVSADKTPFCVVGIISVLEDLGDETRIGVRYGDFLLMSSTARTERFKTGDTIYLSFNQEDLNLFDVTTGERLINGGAG